MVETSEEIYETEIKEKLFMGLFKRKLKIINQDNGAVVFDKTRGIYFQTNDIGIFILNLINENKDIDEISSRISSIFGISIEEASTDVKNFIVSLRKVGLN